jgi:hypothetical protein
MSSYMDEYDQDFYLWTQRQAKLLHERCFDEIDLPNLIEEVESMARQLAHELGDRMADVVRLRLLLHALPDEAWAACWKETVRQQCHMNSLILRDAPSLNDRLPAMIEEASETGRLRAVEELAYAFPRRRFDDLLSSMPPLKVKDFFG